MNKKEILLGLLPLLVLALLCVAVSLLAAPQPLPADYYLFSDPWYPLPLRR